MNRSHLRRAVGLLALAAAVSSCGDFVEESGGGGFIPNGRVCYVESDCVPNDCCGRGTGVLHVDDAPDCSNVMCDGTCSPEMTECGCGLPICRDGQCEVARTYGEGCE